MVRTRSALACGLAFALAMVTTLVPQASSAADPDGCVSHGTKYEPADGQVVHIIGQDTASIDEYVQSTGIVPGAVMSYTSLALLAGLYTPFEWGAGEQHLSKLLERYPDSAIQLGIDMSDSLDATNAGALDGNILILADYVKRAEVPFFIRIGYEFDGPHNGYQAPAYVAAYRRIVDKFREQGVTNVSWVWHGHGYVADKGHLARYYPGDAYVDWAAISFFVHHRQNPAIPGAHAMADFAAARGKPLMIAESTPRGLGVHKGQESWDTWFAPLFRFIEERGVKALSYINANWDAQGRWVGWGDSRVQANPYVFEQWMAIVSQANYLKASPTLFCDAATALSVDAPEAAHATDRMTVTAHLTAGGAPVPGQTVRVEVGPLADTATTDGAGRARVTVDLDIDPARWPVTATFAGTPGHAPSTAAAASVDVLPDQTVLTYTGDTVGVGDTVRASATLADDDSSPLAGQPVTFSAGEYTATATTDAAGHAEAALTVPDHGPSRQVDVAYPGATRYAPATTSATVTWGLRQPVR